MYTDLHNWLLCNSSQSLLKPRGSVHVCRDLLSILLCSGHFYWVSTCGHKSIPAWGWNSHWKYSDKDTSPFLSLFSSLGLSLMYINWQVHVCLTGGGPELHTYTHRQSSEANSVRGGSVHTERCRRVSIQADVFFLWFTALISLMQLPLTIHTLTHSTTTGFPLPISQWFDTSQMTVDPLFKNKLFDVGWWLTDHVTSCD